VGDDNDDTRKYNVINPLGSGVATQGLDGALHRGPQIQESLGI
jgi:hypothetical protein